MNKPTHEVEKIMHCKINEMDKIVSLNFGNIYWNHYIHVNRDGANILYKACKNNLLNINNRSTDDEKYEAYINYMKKNNITIISCGLETFD